MNYEIGNPQMFWLLLFAPIALMLMAYRAWSCRKALAKFGTKPTAGQSTRGFVSAVALAAGIVLMALACADIRWGKTTRDVPQKGLEVVFALDVSRSMLAEDARPNRLARAKQQITDMVGEMAGDRIGLVVFAGEAKQAIPLTKHYNDFRQKLESVGPHSVSKGGSQLGVAIQAAADAFITKTNGNKTIVLFTDGEDQESKPVELSRKLFNENELRIFTVGLGDIDKGARIPQDRQGRESSRQFMEHEGQQVWSKLNGRVLKEIATETQGAYIPAGTKRVNMADVYHRFIASVEKSEFESAKINAFIPRFQWFAFPAFICLLIHGWLSTAQNRNKVSRTIQSGKRLKPDATASKLSSGKTSKVAAAAIGLMLLPCTVNAQSTTDSKNQRATAETVAAQINAANDLVRKDRNTEAIELFNAIEATAPNERDSLNYNLAVAHYGNSDFDAAISLLAESAKSGNDRIAADSRYNLGNCHFAKSLPLAQEPEAAIQELELAVEHYRSAIRLDRKLADARENLERALKLIDQLNQNQQSDQQQDPPEQDQKSEDQEKDQEEQNEQQEQQEDQSEDQEEQQSEESDQNEQQDSASDSDSQDGEEENSEENQSSQSQDEQGESQQDPDGESQPDQSSENQPGNQSEDNPQQSQDSQSSDDSPSDQQTNSQQQRQQNESQSAESSEQNDQQKGDASDKDNKDPPQGEISAANQSPSDEASEELMLESTEQDENKEGIMSRQEALKLLQAVRDRDLLRRLRQHQLQRNRRVPVDKDW